MAKSKSGLPMIGRALMLLACAVLAAFSGKKSTEPADATAATSAAMPAAPTAVVYMGGDILTMVGREARYAAPRRWTSSG